MEALKNNHNRLITLKQAKKLVISLVVVLLFDFILYPIPAMASEIADPANTVPQETQDLPIINTAQEAPEIINNLPENNDTKVKSSGYHSITAYNSEPGQCDNSPCTTANGFNVCEHGIEDTVAANFLKFGTKIKIPELFGDRIFVVRDRMNARYQDRLDIWMIEKSDAIKFGVRYAKIEILQEP